MAAPKYLKEITKGPIVLPLFGAIYGVEGVGKTTFVDKLPDPVFVGPEVTQKIKGSRFPVPASWEDFLAQLDDLMNPYYTYKSLGVDSLDHLEQYLFEYLRRVYKVTSHEDAGGSFGKWVGIAQREWLKVLAKCEALREEKKMNVIFLAHSDIKVFNDPLTAKPYDRYRMKLNDKCAAIIREKLDFIFFANFKTAVVTENSKATKGRGVSDGARLIYTEKRASHDAKNRFTMPSDMPFDFNLIMKYVDAAPAEQIVTLQKDIEALMLEVKDQSKLETIKAFFAENKDDVDTCVNIKNSLKVIVGEVLYEAE